MSIDKLNIDKGLDEPKPNPRKRVEATGTDFVSRPFLKKFSNYIVMLRLRTGGTTTGRILDMDDHCVLVQHRRGTMRAFAISEIIDVMMIGE